MRKTSTSDGGVGRLLESVDPGRSVSESELARSRARSLAVLDSPATAGVGPAARTTAHTTPRAASHSTFRAGPPRLRRRVLLASAAAALLVGGIVVADVVRPGGPGATAEAADVLNEAAAATIRTSDPVVGPGQYLKVDTTALLDTGFAYADGTEMSWQATMGDQLYVPADKEGEWVWNREDPVPVESSSDAEKAAAAEMVQLLSANGNPAVGIQRAPGGAFYGNGPTVIIGTALQEAGTLPRDPRELLDVIYERTKESGKTPESAAFTTIADGLRSGVVPADLRAALYQAAALIPGVIVADRQATVDGRTGIAIGFPFEDYERYDIIIDPASGLVIGEQHVLLKDIPGSPSGTVSAWTSVTTSVVDSAP